MPYLDRFANRLETLEICLLVGILGFGMVFIEDETHLTDTKRTALVMILILFYSCVFALLSVFLYAVFVASCPKVAHAHRQKKMMALLPQLQMSCHILQRQT